MTDTVNAKTATFSVYQTDQNDGTSECLCWGLTEKEAQAEADRINRDLAKRGIPSWVSTAYVALAKPLHNDTSHHHPPVMTDQHPVTPPQELLLDWDNLPLSTFEIFVIAAQWGADQELEACCEWLAIHFAGVEKILRAARRPKPPSLKEQALKTLEDAPGPDYPRAMTVLNADQHALIRKALEALPHD